MSTKQIPEEIRHFLKGVDVWDEKYDYVMHNDHWLTSKYSATCAECQKRNETFYKSALELTPENDVTPTNGNSNGNAVGQLLDLGTDQPSTHYTGMNIMSTPLHPQLTNKINTNTTSRGKTFNNKKIISNLELLTNIENNDHFNLAALSKEIEQIGQIEPVTSRIPRRPLKFSR